MNNLRFTVRSTAITLSVCLAVLIHCGDRNQPEADLGPLPQVDLSTLDPDLSDRLTKKLTILRANPQDLSANGDVAKLLHAYERFELALPFYQRAQTLEPTSVRWPYYQGVIHTNQGRYDEAIELFKSTLVLDPTFVQANRRLARALLDDGQLDESLRVYNGLVTDQPEEPETRTGIGKVHLALGNSAAAAAHLARAVEMLPNYGEAHYALALAYRDLGDEENAAHHIKRFEDDKLGEPPSTDPLLTAVNSLRSSAREYLKAGIEAHELDRIPDAIKHHVRALELDPALNQAHVNLIVLYGLVGEPGSAELHYQKALAQNPDSVALHHNYGRLSYDRGEYDQAYSSFQRALRLNPENAFANNDMGETNEQVGRLDEAIGYYRRAVANRPDYAHAHFNLGRTMMQKGRTADAIREFRLALREESFRTPTYLATLASAYVSLGRVSDAADTLGLARRMAETYGQSELVNEINMDMDLLTAQRAR